MKYIYISLLAAMSFGQQLFISEYIEGSSNNKALEIYNPTGSSVNLVGYELWRIANGGDWTEGQGNSVDLSGYSIASGDVFVICNSSIAPEYSSACDVLGTDITYYNGDDAVGLAYNGNLIDAIGEAGDDPGSAWDVAGVTNATKEHTLVRKISVTQGNTNWATSAGTNGDNSEWVVFDQNTFDYLGSHSELGDVEGCTDPNAANYNPSATTSCNGDNSCCQYASNQSIYDIQYTDDIGEGTYDCYPSPYGIFGNEQYVTTTGIITAVKPGSSPNFYIQDFSSNTYAGIYVFDNAWSPILGSEVTVTGKITEYYGFTEITELTSFVVNSSNNSTDVKNITTGELANGCTVTGEALEGMLVRVNNVTVAQEINEYGEWYVNDGSGLCQIDDAMFDGEWITPNTGQQFDAITGVVDYAYSKFGVLPRTMSDIVLDSDQPVADCGEDQVVVTGSNVTLDGTGSTDNGSIIAYEWTQLSGTTVTLSDEEAAATSFTAPSSTGDLEFRLTVYDNDFNEATCETTVTISDPINVQDIQCPADLEQGEYCFETSLDGQTVITSGVVTAVKPGEYPNFFIQQSDATECGGIYVFDLSVTPQIGDELIISGTVNENYSMTELTDVNTHTTVSSGNQTTPLYITTGELGITCSLNGEKLESMLVRVGNATVEGFDDWGNWIINDGSGQCKVSDYLFDGNFPTVNVGDNVGPIVGLVSNYPSSEYQIQPRNENDFGNCPVEPADVNCDGTWNILDIVTLANCILTNNCPDLECGCAGDVNGDGNYNVLDIVILANCILSVNCDGLGRSDDASSASLIMKDNALSIEADGFIGGVQMTLSHGESFQIELTDRVLYANSITEGNETRLIIVTPETDHLFSCSGDFDIEEVIVANSMDEVAVSLPVSMKYSLSQAYPNPFNPVTSMTFTMPVSGEISVEVYNLIGQSIATLATGYHDAGTYNLTWNAKDVSSGMYFVKAQADGFSHTQKLMLMK